MRKLLLVGAAALTLVGLGAATATGQTPRNEAFRMLALFGDVLGIVEQAYVVPVDDKKLIEAALQGMMGALDPHSNYLPPAGFDELQERTSGAYSGVGLTIQAEGGLVKVISPMDGGPAARAGVNAGDVISSIEGQSAAGLTVSQVSEKLRGAVGTSVQVTFLRDGEEPREVTLTREVIKIDSVTGRIEGDFAYLRISTFNENTGRELGETIARLKTENPALKGYVLDLRNNGGGLLDAAIAVSDAFLERGEIVSQRGRKADQIQRYGARPGDLTGGLPVVVLINYGSASASEIVAGALKDHQRATIVGLTSFGKGSVQTVIPLRNGADGALSITTARYFTPRGPRSRRSASSRTWKCPARWPRRGSCRVRTSSTPRPPMPRRWTLRSGPSARVPTSRMRPPARAGPRTRTISWSAPSTSCGRAAIWPSWRRLRRASS